MMDLSAINHNTQALHAPAPAIPVDQAAENREMVQAVKALNGAEMFGEDNQLMFQRDLQSQRMVLRIVNQKTREVVSEVPAEYILRLAEDLKQPEYVVRLAEDLKRSG